MSPTSGNPLYEHALGTDCDELAADAPEDYATNPGTKLTDVRDARPEQDNRMFEMTLPEGETRSTILSCLAEAEWADGETAPVRVAWQIDSNAKQWVVVEVITDSNRHRNDLGPVIDWASAKGHIGERATVCGNLAEAVPNGDDLFINVGMRYPSPERFTIVVWDDTSKAAQFKAQAEEITARACATGKITEFQGVAQIQLRDASGVEVGIE